MNPPYDPVSSDPAFAHSHAVGIVRDPAPQPWGAILGGSLAGVGALALMATLGAAIGISAGAATADEVSTAETAANAAIGFGLGAAVWTILTAAVVGLVGGKVLKTLGRPGTLWRPGLFGTLTWAGGLMLAGLLTASGAAGLLGGASGLAGAAAAQSQPFASRTLDPTLPGLRGSERVADRLVDGATPRDATATRDNRDTREAGVVLTPEERVRARAAAERAATAAATAAWVALISMLVGLGATILGARPRQGEERAVPVRTGRSPVAVG